MTSGKKSIWEASTNILNKLLDATSEMKFDSNGDREFEEAGYAYDAKDYQRMMVLLRKAAEKGHLEAQYRLGSFNYSGEVSPKNLKEAFYWFRKAAEGGHPKAQGTVGEMYSFGIYVDKDYDEAFHWFTKGADQGDNLSLFSIAGLYHFGKGVEKDETKELKYLKLAYHQGYRDAQASLAHIYAYGLAGQDEDPLNAFLMAKESAENGSLLGQTYLGIFYYEGKGTEEDVIKGKAILQELVDKGYAPAYMAMRNIKEIEKLEK